jgi:hypothetical protein
MRYLKIGWTVLLNLIALAIIAAMLAKAKSGFEQMVVSALVLIYVQVTSSFSVLGRALMEMGNADLARFNEVAGALKHPDAQVYRDAHKEQTEEIAKTRAPYWINVGFAFLFFLIAVAGLIGAL